MTDIPSDEHISQRAIYLRSIADSLIKEGVISDADVIFRTNKMQLITEAYFLLNQAYKEWRIEDGHNTQPPKIAALTCMVIGTFQPFLPKNPQHATTFQQARSNEIYSLACASAITGVPLFKNKQDVYLRLLDVLSHCDCETVQPYLVDKHLKNSRPLNTYKFKIHDKDRLLIDSLITIFEMAWLVRKK